MCEVFGCQPHLYVLGVWMSDHVSPVLHNILHRALKIFFQFLLLIHFSLLLNVLRVNWQSFSLTSLCSNFVFMPTGQWAGHAGGQPP